MIEDTVSHITIRYTAEGLGGEVLPTQAQKDLYEKMLREEFEYLYPNAIVNLAEGDDDTLAVYEDPPQPSFRTQELVQADMEAVWEKWLGIA